MHALREKGGRVAQRAGKRYMKGGMGGRMAVKWAVGLCSPAAQPARSI